MSIYYIIKIKDIDRKSKDMKNDSKKRVLIAAQQQGVSSVLFRNAIGRKMGLSVTDSECLSYLSMRRNASPKELSQYTGLTTGSTTAMLDRLEKAGYIHRTSNPDDRRGVVVEIDKKWMEKAGPLVAGVQKAHTTLIAEYSDEELEVIADFLERFTQNVQDQTNEIKKM